MPIDVLPDGQGCWHISRYKIHNLYRPEINSQSNNEGFANRQRILYLLLKICSLISIPKKYMITGRETLT
jgi:hypothetical protein